MTKSPRSYSEEFRKNAVALSYATKKTLAETAEELGVGFSTLTTWRKKYENLGSENRDVAEWPEVFPDGILAAASLDRMFDRADVNIFLRKSYRMKGRINEEVVDGKKPMSHEA